VPPPADAREPAAVRPLREDDLAQAAALHADALPEGFFSQLGPRFLRRYLATFLRAPGAVALAAERDGHFAGFVVGTGGGHYRWALREAWRELLPVAVVALVRHPGAALRLVRTRTRRYGKALLRARAETRHPDAAPAAPASAPAALLHVAVRPEDRAAGLGAALVRGFEEQARSAGRRRVRLVAFGEPDEGASTDGSDAKADGLEAFYGRLGFRRVQVKRDEAGRRVLVFERNL
jgi:ribosomal protein S18 acetylase RimI-like enzyme